MNISKVEATIKDTFHKDRPALMPYFTVGYPDFETSLSVIQACIEADADMIELGIPFSDPLADGPTIQHSTQIALKNGMTVERCLDAVACLRQQYTIPILLMGYINPILSYGVEAFIDAASEAGANGFIIPDLPPEEAGSFEEYCKGKGMILPYLLAPNSTPDRIKLVARRSTGFIYLVSVTGTTGARDSMPINLKSFVAKVRGETELPLAVGFGISKPEHAKTVGAIADGVIIGSALIEVVGQANDPPAAAFNFIREMRSALIENC